MPRPRILVVEDETIVSLDVQARLTDLGYEVAGVADRGEEALALAERERPDLVLMDIRLKGAMDGIAAAEEIRRRWNLPVVYLTAFSEESTLQRAKVTEPFGYILKPFEDREIQSVIEMALFKHQAETRLRESEERYRGLFDRSLDCLFLTDFQGRFLDANPAALALLGYAREEIQELDFVALLSPDQLSVAFRTVEEIMARGFHQGPTEFRLRRKDGACVQVESQAALVYRQGRPYAIQGIARDITERKRAEAALKLNEARLEGLLRINAHPAETIQELLDMALEEAITLTGSLLGYIYFYDEGRQEFTLNTWSREVLPQCQVANPQTVYQLARTGIWGEAVRQARPIMVNDWTAPNPLKRGMPEGHAPLGRFLTIPVKRQERIVAVVGVANKAEPYDDSDVRQLSLMMDAVWTIVERKQAEETQARLQDQLRQAQKMESVGRLAGGVAHDFNNMLGVILGHAEMALAELSPQDPVYPRMKDIHAAAARSAELTGQLLAFARRQTVAPRVLDLNATVAGMLKMLQRLIGEDIEVSWQPGTDLWPVRVDPSQVDQILANLCVNARDAMGAHGRLVIETGNRVVTAEEAAAAPEAQAGEFVMLAVSDNGSGMSPEIMEHIFEPFFTTKPVGVGTGLGLATVYGIVKQNEGFVQVASAPGQGAAFRIHLPRHAVKEGAAARGENGRSASTGGETILLVEDEPMILGMTAAMLRRLGYHVLPAATPGAALRLAREHAGTIHLLMTDVVMPEMNGRELARNLLALYPDLKRLFMSGYTADVIAHHGVLDEGVHFIQKPFSMTDLAAKVRAALEAG